MEATMVHWGYVGMMEKIMETIGIIGTSCGRVGFRDQGSG